VLEQHPDILVVFDEEDPAHQRLLDANGEITGSNSGPVRGTRSPNINPRVVPAFHRREIYLLI
jgi:hypothetical protein